MLYKRNNTYYTSYYHNGKRYRQSLHTTDEKQAKSREITIISYMTDNAIKTGEISCGGILSVGIFIIWRGINPRASSISNAGLWS